MTYKNKVTRLRGSSGMDLADKNQVKKILEKLGATNIKYDQFLLAPKNIEHRTTLVTSSVTEAECQEWKILAHPDITCWWQGGRLIVEIDGAYHKDYDYDKRYEEYDLNYIKINKEHLRDIDMPWEDYILYQLGGI